MRRGIVLALLLGCVALTDTHDVRFVLPVRPIVLAGPRGVTVAYQAWIKRDARNRWVQLEVWDGEIRIKSDGWDIDGDAAQVQPAYRPLTVQLGPGRYAFRAFACSAVEDAQCTKVRASAVYAFQVCGESCNEFQRDVLWFEAGATSPKTVIAKTPRR
jgi:hypothetical protein